MAVKVLDKKKLIIIEKERMGDEIYALAVEKLFVSINNIYWKEIDLLHVWDIIYLLL